VRLPTDDGKTYVAKDVFFTDKMVLFKKVENICLPADQTQFSFEFLIPDHCPTSFQGTYITVAYKCVASVKFCELLAKKQVLDKNFLLAPANISSADVPDCKIIPDKNLLHVEKNFGAKNKQTKEKPIILGLSTDRATVTRRGSFGEKSLSFQVTVENRGQFSVGSLRYGILQVCQSSYKNRQITEHQILWEYCSGDLFQVKPNDKFLSDPVKLVFCEKIREDTTEDDFEMVFCPEPSLSVKLDKMKCDVSYCIFAILAPKNFGDVCEIQLPIKIL